jgi:hypothetical protein
MIATLCISTTGHAPYCSIHQRVWVEELAHWVAGLEPPVDGSAVTEGACDTCMECVFETFRAQFPGLYASGA